MKHRMMLLLNSAARWARHWLNTGNQPVNLLNSLSLSQIKKVPARFVCRQGLFTVLASLSRVLLRKFLRAVDLADSIAISDRAARARSEIAIEMELKKIEHKLTVCKVADLS